MNWDVSIVTELDGQEVEVLDCGNYTYNVSPMFTDSMGASLSELDGMPCKAIWGSCEFQRLDYTGFVPGGEK